APVVLVAFCAAIAAAWRLVASLSHPAPGPGAARRDRLLLSLPIARRLLPCLWSSRFAATMSLLLDAGLSPQDSILPAGEATGSPLVASLAQSASASVRQGAPLSQAVASIAPLAKSLSAWFAVGEKTGSLAAMLSSAADRARNDYERALKRVLSLLEPLLVAVVGLAVLAVALAVLRPMLDLTTGAAL
ncbi:MAG: type II secretion system F family protein, partial [Kiritimatiellae bacterium]|nr:type II secretion system F family protein [Kiritimatiellia bacterium]